MPSLAPWPDALDLAALTLFALSVLATTATGYALLVLDIRAYLRSLRRSLVRVVRYFPQWPAWAQVQTPPCLAAFGLRLPCTAADLLRAYRRQVKRLHPDRGGDKQRFLLLQSQFEQAQTFLDSWQDVR
jgi:hypothetical protein